jgi:hypothetical protein
MENFYHEGHEVHTKAHKEASPWYNPFVRLRGSYFYAEDHSDFEQGLACNTNYSRYIWAYSSCNVSQPIILICSTLGCSPVVLVTETGYAYNNDYLNVQWSTDGVTWQTVTRIYLYGPVQEWKVINVPLLSGAASTIYLGFDFVSAFGNSCHLDQVHLTGY